MPKQNIIPIENKKPTETVYELKDYEIKKSPLSASARSKVINKSGSNYVSENKEGYGACTSSYCSCSNYQLRQQLRRKQEELDTFWEKFNEYKERWESYVSKRDDLDERQRTIEGGQRAGSHMVSVIPFGSMIFDAAMGAVNVSNSAENQSTLYSYTRRIRDKYDEIKNWYNRIRS